jgi:hypothetical protein
MSQWLQRNADSSVDVHIGPKRPLFAALVTGLAWPSVGFWSRLSSFGAGQFGRLPITQGGTGR